MKKLLMAIPKPKRKDYYSICKDGFKMFDYLKYIKALEAYSKHLESLNEQKKRV